MRPLFPNQSHRFLAKLLRTISSIRLVNLAAMESTILVRPAHEKTPINRTWNGHIVVLLELHDAALHGFESADQAENALFLIESDRLHVELLPILFVDDERFRDRNGGLDDRHGLVEKSGREIVFDVFVEIIGEHHERIHAVHVLMGVDSLGEAGDEKRHAG